MPASTERPPGVRQPELNPPGVLLASNIVTLTPALSSAYAAPKPAHPPPTTTTCLPSASCLASVGQAQLNASTGKVDNALNKALQAHDGIARW